MSDAFDVRRGEKIALNVVLQYGLITGKKGAWFCHECVNGDLQTHGMPYWRRDHQLCGVDWCYRHRVKLSGFSTHVAFSKPPPIHSFGIDLLSSDGPQFLDDTAQIVQNFAAIAKALLERRTNLDVIKVTSILRRQALTLMSEGSHVKQFDLQGLVEEKMPDFWQNHFYQIKGSGKGKDLLDFGLAFRQSQYSAPTVVYVMALALLFETPVEALLKLDEAEDIGIVPENMKLRYEREFWSSDHVLNEYAKSRGSYESFCRNVGTDFQRTADALPIHGLPDLTSVSEDRKGALLAFFRGESLFNICQIFQLEITDLEDLLRISGSRFAKGLADMTAHMEE